MHNGFKSLWLYTLACTVALVFGVSTASAQLPTPPCPSVVPDCPSTPFLQGGCYITVIEVSSGVFCSAEICYCYRIACGVWYDFFVTRVRLLNPACAPGASTQSVVQAAARQLVLDNPRHWPCPPCPLSNYNWRVLSSPCWRTEIYEGTIVYLPCNATGQCFELYKVCCDPQTGQRSVSIVSRSAAGQCTNPQCTVICN